MVDPDIAPTFHLADPDNSQASTSRAITGPGGCERRFAGPPRRSWCSGLAADAAKRLSGRLDSTMIGPGMHRRSLPHMSGSRDMSPHNDARHARERSNSPFGAARAGGPAQGSAPIKLVDDVIDKASALTAGGARRLVATLRKTEI